MRIQHQWMKLFIFLCYFTGAFPASYSETLLALNHPNYSGLTDLKESLIDFSPSLSSTSKPGFNQLFSTETGQQQSHVVLQGSDSQTRPIAVNFQRAFEQSIIKMINQGKVKQVTAIIHTDRPTTPLCHQPDLIQMDSLPESIQTDPKRLKTIKDRTQSVRLLARDRHINLYVTYTKSGLYKRSEQELAIFKQETNDRRNIALKNKELSCSSVPDDISGATYVLELANGEQLFFSLNGTQAQDADKTMSWEYWFDSLKNPDMKNRLDKVLGFLNQCGVNISI